MIQIIIKIELKFSFLTESNEVIANMNFHFTEEEHRRNDQEICKMDLRNPKRLLNSEHSNYRLLGWKKKAVALITRWIKRSVSVFVVATMAAENCDALSESRNNCGLRFRQKRRNPISSFSLSPKGRKVRGSRLRARRTEIVKAKDKTEIDNVGSCVPREGPLSRAHHSCLSSLESLEMKKKGWSTLFHGFPFVGWPLQNNYASVDCELEETMRLVFALVPPLVSFGIEFPTYDLVLSGIVCYLETRWWTTWNEISAYERDSIAADKLSSEHPLWQAR